MVSPLLPYAFFEGEIVPLESAKVSIATHALQYGTGVFGGVRGYLDVSGQCINIFRLSDHLDRLLGAMGLLRMTLPYDRPTLEALWVELTQRNAARSNVYYRPFVYKAGYELTPTLSGIPDQFALYMITLGDFYTKGGLSVMVSSWRRISDQAIPARGKITGAYINSSLVKDEAKRLGFDEAILLNSQGKVSEASAANIFMVRRGTLITPPITADILEGITRSTVLELAADAGIPILERDIDRSELFFADELFVCGTGAQVTAITAVDLQPIGLGEPGPITQTLTQAFQDVVTGQRSAYRHWLTPIPLTPPT
ncbi:branched-chain amino acid transaminase [Prochlorothrix hollandica]|uniref:Branched-chain-amino-acid aminotransferase n=1 Tax=Prochlorothrix hollandica PCC 9006 = CALU 1027 TaxID=317619 RepID=A0A0M2PST4_PROHO|nr:branched-chain amino acid transaminase [Prochlorothrix hollandica]KKI98207.1 branched-chain amino acid aminotransferase [Prochlorothrix hollandica PCC 9006 = CALU 1027]